MKSLTIYLSYLRLAWFFRKHFGIKTYGIGWIATKVGHAFDFKFNGVPFRFLPAAARSYCLLPAGIPNEPETHLFLSRVLAFPPPPRGILFIDIGASIGEFAVPMAHDTRIVKVVAFEPHPVTATALRLSADMAPSGKLQVIEMGVGDKVGAAYFDLHDRAPTAAGLQRSEGQAALAAIRVCTLDDEIEEVSTDTPLLILVDIEGGELDALRGGQRLISRNNPMIIFEYNAITRGFFALNQAQDLLGPGYRLYRLRSEDGRLDCDFSTTWNVVALPHYGPWRHLHHQPGLFVE